MTCENVISIRRSDLISSPSYRDDWPCDVMCPRDAVNYLLCQLAPNWATRISLLLHRGTRRFTRIAKFIDGSFYNDFVFTKDLFLSYFKTKKERKRETLCYIVLHLIFLFN